MPVGTTNSCPILTLRPQIKFVPQEILGIVLFQFVILSRRFFFETLRTKIFSFFTKSLVCGRRPCESHEFFVNEMSACENCWFCLRRRNSRRYVVSASADLLFRFL